MLCETYGIARNILVNKTRFMDLKQGKVTGERYKLKYSKNKPQFNINKQGFEHANYDKPITMKNVADLRSISRKSVSQFNSHDIQKSQKWAYHYFKELGTKSPFFRNWFGDWRAYDKTTIKIATNDNNTIRGNIKNKDTNWNIRVSRNGIGNTKAHSGDNKFSVNGLTLIKSLIENAVLLNTETHEFHGNDKNERIAFDHKLYALGKSQNGTALYRITVEEIYQSTNSQHEKRFHNLKYIEKVADELSRLTDKPNGNHAVSTPTTTNLSVANLYDLVKKYDKEFTGKSKEISELVIDEYGKPKIFAHGTNSPITKIIEDEDYIAKGSKGNFGGIFLLPGEKGGYGDYDQQFYLRSNIADTSDLRHVFYDRESDFDTEEFFNKFFKHELSDEEYYEAKRLVLEDYSNLNDEENEIIDNLFSELKDYDFSYRYITAQRLRGQFAKANGFGAVTIYDEFDGDSILVTEPSDIKSATDNIGNFDEDNDDIYFSVVQDEKLLDELEKGETVTIGDEVDY